MVPASSSFSPLAYDAARRRAGVLDRSDRGRILVSGRDRASFLQGLLSNDVAVLARGHGCYATYLTPAGRMITDLCVYDLGDVLLLALPRAVKDAVLARLDQLVFTEDVQLGDVSATYAGVAVVGPAAPTVVATVLDGVTADTLAALPEHGNLRGHAAGEPVIVLGVSDTGEPGFELLAPVARIGALRAALASAGAVEIDPATAEVLRVEAGIPKFHQDMDEETIPLEAGIESRAISLTKGCYVGQEVIVRVLHRGHGRVARKLVGLTIDGVAAPHRGAIVTCGPREVGRVTSAVMSPALGLPLALGYVHRDFASPDQVLAVGGARAVVTARPFVSKAAGGFTNPRES
jgi:folate-binding protein YgfZ